MPAARIVLRVDPIRPDMRFRTRLALGLGAFALSVLLVLVAVPFLFAGRIDRLLQREVNAAVNARVSWVGSGVSLLRDFPNASVRIERLAIVGTAPFAGDTLLTLRNARLVLDLGSVIGHFRGGETVVVRELVLDRPDARLRVLEDGRANWDIARASAPEKTAAGKAVRVALRDLRITDADVSLDDAQARVQLAVRGFDERLRGDLSEDRVALRTETRADSVSVRFAGVPYLSRVGVRLDADVDADMRAKRFVVRDAALHLNALQLTFGGSVTASEPDLALDLRFAAPGTAFRDILSLVPAIYASRFEDLQTTGTMAVMGQVRGRYGPKAFPALAVRARVDKGAFRHKGMPLPAHDIGLELAIDNPGGHVDRTVVDLKRFHAVIGGRPVDARFVMRTPVSDPDVDLRLKGSLDLADVARTMQLDGVRSLAGVVDADVAMRARLSDVDGRRYDRVTAAGTVRASRVAVQSDAVPYPVAVDTAALRLTPRTAELTAFAARVGASDVRATGALDNILGFLLRDEDLRGRAAIASNHVDLDEWKSDDALTVVPVPKGVDLALHANVGRVTHGALMMSDVRGNLRVREQRATLDSLQLDMLRGTVIATGWYETTVADRPTFDIDLRLASVDIPSAFAALTTVQKFAPVARWAQGGVSGTIALEGTLGEDMMPLFAGLTGKGEIETERLVVRDAPVLGRMADALSLDALRNPALGTVRAAFDVVDGRLRVKPFATTVAGIAMSVAGSNGIDQSLLYDVALQVPRELLGGGITRLASQAKQAGVELDAGAVVALGAKINGTVSDPNVKPDFAGTASSLRTAAQGVVQAGVAERVEAVEQKADSAAEAARARARDEAAKALAEAEEQAAKIREEARELAEKVRAEANVRADSVQARATSPAARIAAKAATDRLRKEGDAQAERIVREADAKADALLAAARARYPAP